MSTVQAGRHYPPSSWGKGRKDATSPPVLMTTYIGCSISDLDTTVTS